MHSLTWRHTYAGWVSTKLHEDTTKLQKYPPHTGYSSQASLTLRHVSGVKRGLDMIKHKKYRFIHNQDPLYMLDIWMRVHVLERQKFHGCRYTTSPVFPGILRIGLLSGRPNSTHLYTQTTRLNASQPAPSYSETARAGSG